MRFRFVSEVHTVRLLTTLQVRGEYFDKKNSVECLILMHFFLNYHVPLTAGPSGRAV